MNFEIENGTLIRYIGEDKEVIIPKEVREIDADAFMDTVAEKIIIPDGVECYVNAYALMHCYGLKYVYFDSNVDIAQGYYINGDLYDGADTIFFCCEAMEKVEVSPDNPYISSVDGKLYNKDKTILFFDPDNKYWEEEDWSEKYCRIGGLVEFAEGEGLYSIKECDDSTLTEEPVEFAEGLYDVRKCDETTEDMGDC